MSMLLGLSPIIFCNLYIHFFVSASDKRYQAIIRMGASTDTFDADGRFVKPPVDALDITEEQFEEKRKLAIQVLDKYYDEFIKKHYDKIQKGLHLSDDALKQVLHQIVSLNPKPGAESAFTNNPEQYIVPDFTVQLVNNKPELIIEIIIAISFKYLCLALNLYLNNNMLKN